MTNLILDERMDYVTMDKLDPERLPDVVEGLTREDVMMECHQQFSLRRHLHFLTQPLFLLVITNSRTLKIANHHTKKDLVK